MGTSEKREATSKRELGGGAITHFPCGGCFKAMVNAGIVRVVYSEVRYIDAPVISTAAALSIPLVGPSPSQG